ncbi:hypothetical protein [Halobacillus karajensis]|uniref:Uncharacterized protein n=1 Tax=Halobacillus karajensis TaxID=195088 RepID=A0A059NW95_9BACI|nr:hypothetical protein [Halobacillus karajensis]CDQ22583.1 hypothetical protein BN983_00796 [Halobacillus karajensis]CDQ26065.1 hypothetical protein BN981_00276 [Halobacillus karajensis]
MIEANVEIIHEDETSVTYRISWYIFGELKEKWITERKGQPD